VIPVRLSRDGQWAVCARVECGTRFARRFVRLAERQVVRVAGSDEPLDVPLGEDRAVLRFLPGWVNRNRPLPDEVLDRWPGGVWRMSNRVWARISNGEPPAFRRANRHRWQRELSKTAIGFPALVICPACDLIQILDEEVLALR
jgi:hypothetical protein